MVPSLEGTTAKSAHMLTSCRWVIWEGSYLDEDLLYKNCKRAMKRSFLREWLTSLREVSPWRAERISMVVQLTHEASVDKWWRQVHGSSHWDQPGTLHRGLTLRPILWKCAVWPYVLFHIVWNILSNKIIMCTWPWKYNMAMLQLYLKVESGIVIQYTFLWN